MILIAGLVTAFKLTWIWLMRDRLPLAVSGWYLAFVVVQLSGGLQQAIMDPLAVTVLFAAAWLVQHASQRSLKTKYL